MPAMVHVIHWHLSGKPLPQFFIHGEYSGNDKHGHCCHHSYAQDSVGQIPSSFLISFVSIITNLVFS